jgi:hypothetical protein
LTATPPVLEFNTFVTEVRSFIRDWEELNRLISGEESSNRTIEYCIWLALDEWNTTPPLSGNSIEDFPSRLILLHLTVIHLLSSVGILKTRNRLTYNDGGFSVQTEEQDVGYQRWIQLFRQMVDPKILKLKVALNIESGWNAGVGSEYGWLYGWYGATG